MEVRSLLHKHRREGRRECVGDRHAEPLRGFWRLDLLRGSESYVEEAAVSA
jgi:hypothetical protein